MNEFGLRLPRFLVQDTTVAKAVGIVLDATIRNPKIVEDLTEPMCHIVVLCPSKGAFKDSTDMNWLHAPIQPYLLYEESVNPEKFDNNYLEIARCKAAQLWRGQNNDGLTDSVPHLLFTGDTPYWGGVHRHGLVVACSGIQSHFDQMISGMIADALKAFAYENWSKSDDKKSELPFLVE